MPSARLTRTKLKTGFIGIGGRGIVLLRETLALGVADVVAICDIKQNRIDQGIAEVINSGASKPATYSSSPLHYLELLSRKDIEAVVIATPCNLHGQMYLNSLNADKHLYGEKPLCISLESCNELLIAQAEHKDVVCVIGHQRRANLFYQEAIGRMQEGRLGDLLYGTAAWASSSGNLGTWYDDRSISGDWMLEQACHTWDIFNWLFKGLPVRIHGCGRKDIYTTPRRNVTDAYAALLEWSNGFHLSFFHTTAAPIESPYSGVYERVVGRLGGCEINNGKFSYSAGIPKTVQVGSAVNDTRRLLEAFFESIISGVKAPVSIEEAANAVRVGLAVREAVDTASVTTCISV